MDWFTSWFTSSSLENEKNEDQKEEVVNITSTTVVKKTTTHRSFDSVLKELLAKTIEENRKDESESEPVSNSDEKTHVEIKNQEKTISPPILSNLSFYDELVTKIQTRKRMEENSHENGKEKKDQEGICVQVATTTTTTTTTTRISSSLSKKNLTLNEPPKSFEELLRQSLSTKFKMNQFLASGQEEDEEDESNKWV